MRNKQNQAAGEAVAMPLNLGAKQIIPPGCTPEEGLNSIYNYLVQQLQGGRLQVPLKEVRYTYLHMSMSALGHYHELLSSDTSLSAEMREEKLKNYEELFWLTGELSGFIDTIAQLVDNLPKSFSFICGKSIIYTQMKTSNVNGAYLIEKVKLSDEELIVKLLGTNPNEAIQKIISAYNEWKDEFIVDSSRDLSFEILQDAFSAYAELEDNAVTRVKVQNAMNNWYKSAIFFKEIGQRLDLLEKAFPKPSVDHHSNE